MSDDHVVETTRAYDTMKLDEESKQPQSLLEQAETDEKAVAKRIVRWWTSQNRAMNRRFEEWRVNKARRGGISQVKLIKGDSNIHDYELYAPPNVNVMPHTLNKADRLCRRVVNFIFTDPPMPEAVPARDDDEARDQSETSTRILQSMTDEGNIDDVRTARRALDLGSTYDCGFRHHYIDPLGGGQQPIEMHCHPEATELQHAVPRPLDPNTNTPYPGPYVTKFVTMDGKLTTERGPEIRMEFTPAIRSEVLSGKFVRFLPPMCNDVWEADGLLIGSFQRLGDLKNQFQKIREMPEEELTKLINDPPEGVQRLIKERMELKEQLINDDAMVFTLVHYRKAGGTEKKGVYAVVCGSETLVHIQPWVDPKTQESMDIPVDQFKQFEAEESPYGRGLMRQLGGGNELMAQGLDAVVTHMQRLKNRRIFLPTNSIVQARHFQSPTASVIHMNPGGEPKYEDVPRMPSQYFDFLDLMVREMNDESGLQEVAQGVNTASVQSGLHARQIIEQSMVALSDIRQSTERALIRGYRIYLQLIKAYFTKPQQMQYLGDDGQYKVERWSAANFGDTRDVRLTRGSFTQLSPPAKAAEVERMFQMMDEVTGERMIGLAEARSLIMGNVGGLIGIQDDPYVARVKRQIKAWQAGPTQEYLTNRQKQKQAVEGYQKQMEQIPDEQAKQAMQQKIQQLQEMPIPGNPFDRNPVDEEKPVARVRHFELKRVISSTRFLLQPQEWREPLIAEYQRMRKATGELTQAEEVEAQQKQMQAEQQAAQQEQQAKLQEVQTKVQGNLQQTQLEGEAEMKEKAIPGVNISISGSDLLEATGEIPLDNM